MTNAALGTQVRATSDAVEVEVRDPRPDTVQTFAVLNAPQQHQLAHDAWHVGLRALMNAYRQAEEARLSDIGKTLVEEGTDADGDAVPDIAWFATELDPAPWTTTVPQTGYDRSIERSMQPERLPIPGADCPARQRRPGRTSDQWVPRPASHNTS